MKKLISIIIAICFIFILANPCIAKNDKAKGPSDTAIERANDNASFKRDTAADKPDKCTDLMGKEIACPDDILVLLVLVLVFVLIKTRTKRSEKTNFNS